MGSSMQFKKKFLIAGSPWIIGGIFLLGTVIRLYELDVRSLWRDEAWVALLASSDNLSSAFFTQWPIPPFFISSIYISVHLFKNNEWFLRIIPALFGIGGMVLLYYGVRNWLGKFEAAGSLILFSFTPVLISYSRELKQYTGDIFFALLLIILAEYLLQNINRLLPWIMLALSGSISLWFSFPMVFVLAAIGIITLWYTINHITSTTTDNSMEKYGPLLYWITAFIFIMLSFIMLYFIIIRNQLSEGLESYWSGSFPVLSGIGPFFNWFILSVWSFFVYYWNGYAALVIPFYILGLWELYETKRLRILSYWGTIFVLLLIASFFHRYPFVGNRTILFTAPFFIILFMCGLKSAWRLSKSNYIWKFIACIGILLLAVQTADAAVYYKKDKGYLWYTQIPRNHNMRSALLKLMEVRKENEPLYVYYGGDLAFEYYSKHYFRNSFNPVYIGKMHRDNYSAYIHDMKPLIEEKKPFWLLATHVDGNELSYIDDVISTHYKYIGQIYKQNEGALLLYYSTH